MKQSICKICGSVFIKNSFSNVCSLKCRILEGIKLDDKTQCWNWTKSTCGAYGKVRWKRKTILAHRASYLAFKGEIPGKLFVCHSCDNPLCVNPNHLWLGTQKENKQDASRKGRIPRGEKNTFNKFTDIQIEEIRSLKKEGFTYKRLTRIFNCSISYLFLIIKMKLR